MRAGDTVELRTPTEILATLDENGCLEGLPFMPEMLSYFGQRFTVTAQVARACDTVHYSGVRRLRDTVLLDDLRCDGSGHAGCGAQCRFYWKEAWLRPAATTSEAPAGEREGAFDALDELVRGHAQVSEAGETPMRFRCQATELLRASEPVGWFSIRSALPRAHRRQRRDRPLRPGDDSSRRGGDRATVEAADAHAVPEGGAGRREHATATADARSPPRRARPDQAEAGDRQDAEHGWAEPWSLVRPRDGPVLWADGESEGARRAVHQRGHR